ncbi:MAG: hypothetical protein KY393_06835, partial [Actinobacteria bacterium]|nr:hypothetical protein [Actinomycetota bacterium]
MDIVNDEVSSYIRSLYDRFDDPAIVAGVRFHNLCLPGQDGVARRPEIWRIETANAIGFQRGEDRL